jgi:hypothetical protein
MTSLYIAIVSGFGFMGFMAVLWICATLHEIHLDLKELNRVLAEKQLEIPSPMVVRDWKER